MISNVWDGDWRITQPWGATTLSVEPLWNSPFGPVRWHCGVDIGMYSGTRLYAARAGVVSRSGWGLLGIRIADGSGAVDYYIHIDRALVGLGAAVSQGQLIALSGAKVPSGGSLTGPHLHFEINVAALNVPPAINPMPALQAVFSGGSGSLGGEDLTPDEHNALFHLKTELGVPVTPGGVADLLLKGVVDIKAAIAKLPTTVTSPDTTALVAAIADLKTHPSVVNDPTLATKIDALSKHLGVGTP